MEKHLILKGYMAKLDGPTESNPTVWTRYAGGAQDSEAPKERQSETRWQELREPTLMKLSQNSTTNALTDQT